PTRPIVVVEILGIGISPPVRSRLFITGYCTTGYPGSRTVHACDAPLVARLRRFDGAVWATTRARVREPWHGGSAHRSRVERDRDSVTKSARVPAHHRSTTHEGFFLLREHGRARAANPYHLRRRPVPGSGIRRTGSRRTHPGNSGSSARRLGPLVGRSVR